MKNTNRFSLGWTVLVLLSATLLCAAWQAPVQITAQHDHQRSMDLLGIQSIPSGPSIIDRGAYDEFVANPYPNLPDPLLLKNGEKVRSASMWRQRRAEILEDFEREIYGRTPGNTPRVTWEITSTVNNGVTSVKQLVGHVDNSAYPAIKVDIQASLTTLASPARPVGVILQLTGRGSSPQTGVPSVASMLQLLAPDIPRPDLPPLNPDLLASIRLTLSPITYSTAPWQQQVIARGWGYATINTDSIQADSGAGLTSGIIGLVNKGQPRKLDDWGTLSAWAWGASRFLDYLQTDKSVDANAVGLAGQARLGSASLLAMALDERFAIAYVSSSGVGGAKLYRRKFGETVDNAAAADEYHLFAGNFLKYAGHWDDLPVDSHELIALVAPRPVFIGGGRSVVMEPMSIMDGWADAKGMFMAAAAAGPVYRLLGKKDMGTSEFPPMETPLVAGELAFRQHNGARTDVPNWPTFLTFADRYIKRYIAGPGPSPTPGTFAGRTATIATGNLQNTTLTLKSKGSQSPLAGNWIWTSTTAGVNRKPGRITLKVKISGTKVTGNWTEKETRNDIDGVLQVTDVSDGRVIDSTTISFKRCEGTVHFSIYSGGEDGSFTSNSAFTFIKCERDRSGNLKPNPTVAEYTGKIRGNDLILTVKEIPSH